MQNYKILSVVVAMAALSAPAESAVNAQPTRTTPLEAQKENLFTRLTIDVDGEDYLFAVRKDATGAVVAQHRSHYSHSSHRSHYSSR